MNQDQKEVTEFFQVTPSGSYFATLSPEMDQRRALLLQLLSADTHVPYFPAVLKKLTGQEDKEAQELLNWLTDKGFLQLTSKPEPVPSGSIEQLLPEYLPQLAEGRVLLADQQGFCLGQSGYADEEAEALAALSADIVLMHERHHRLLKDHLGFNSVSWGLLDAAGHSELGFWTIHVGHQKFLLVLEGMPTLNRQSFVDLLSVLMRRYLDY